MYTSNIHIIIWHMALVTVSNHSLYALTNLSLECHWLILAWLQYINLLCIGYVSWERWHGKDGRINWQIDILKANDISRWNCGHYTGSRAKGILIMCQELSSNMGRGKTSRLGSLSSVFSSFPIICCSNGSSISKRSNRSSIKRHEKQDISKKLKEHKMYEKKIGHYKI